MKENLYTKVSVRKVRTIFKIWYSRITDSPNEFTLSIIYPDSKEIIAKLGSVKDLQVLRDLCDMTLQDVLKSRRKK
jgi:hypothetical protein